MSSVASARDGDGDGEHPLIMVMLKEMMLMLMLPPMLMLMALSFTAIMSMCIFFLPRAIKSNRDNYAGGVIRCLSVAEMSSMTRRDVQYELPSPF